MFESIRRYFAVRRYAKRLAPLLEARYGAKPDYRVAEIRVVAEKNNFDRDYLKYAMAILASPAEFRKSGLGDARQRRILADYVTGRWPEATRRSTRSSG